MQRLICVLVCICTSSLVMATNPEKEMKLKKGAIIYAFSEVAWTSKNSYLKNVPTDLLACDTVGCRYLVPACQPLYVASQIKDRTWVLPGDERVRKLIDPTSMRNLLAGSLESEPRAVGASTSVSGGWSTDEGFERNWTLSRDECLAKIGKQPQPPPSASPAPATSQSPAPAPSASPTPTP